MILLLPLFLIGLLLATLDPMKGAVLILATGFLQDAMRKLTPGEPVYFTTFVIVAFAACFVGVVNRGFLRQFRRSTWSRHLNVPVRAFVFVVLLGVGLTIARTGQAVLACIGMASYFGPPAAVLVGYALSRRLSRSLLLVQAYCAGAFVMSLGVYLSVMGFDWSVLGSVGQGLVVYSDLGAVLLPSGFFRAPEIASWHAATAACLLIVLVVVKRRGWIQRIGFAGLFLVLSGAVVLAGRRKGLGEILIFAAFFGAAQIFVRRSLGRLGPLFVILVVFAGLALQYSTLFEAGASQIASMQFRMRTAGGSPADRISAGLASLPEVVRRDGWFGLGVGMLTQGGHHFGADIDLGSVSEGGVARVLGEMGVPGLGISIWLLVRFLRVLYRDVSGVRELRSALAYYVLGLLCLLASNAVVFITAHQVFGDPFVYLWLGMLIGFAMSASEAVRAAVDSRRAPEAAPRPIPRAAIA